MTILATITIIATLSVSMFFTQSSAATATTYNANKMTVTGVLATDSYVLFPYDKANLTFGFSKYGELINGEVGQANGQGLEYKGMDVFANPNVDEEEWSQGWFIDIHYADGSLNYKRAWAFAMYTDLTEESGSIGGDWQEGCTGDTNDAPYGGRKTNVWATTDPIKVLYDGPRRFVALTKTTLYGVSTKTAANALVSITITFVFNKDKKVVTLFKDIKLLDLGKWSTAFQVEFSNRGQWDIGTTTAPLSYAHFYSNQPTAYNYEYHDFYNDVNPITGFDVCQMINKAGTYVGSAAFWPQLYGRLVQSTAALGKTAALHSLCTVMQNQTWLSLGSPSDGNITWSKFPTWDSADSYPRGAGVWSDEPMVFKNGKLQLEGQGEDYRWTGSDGDKIVFAHEPQDADYITIVYKHIETRNDMTEEPKTPYVIGEWCFDLEDGEQKTQFRAVTVYGLTDRHDGDDHDASAETWSNGITSNVMNSEVHNVIDSEVQYYLNETFNPFDLYDAVHKQESRWLYYDDYLDTATSSITLTEGLDDQLYYTQFTAEHASIGATSPTWTGYFIRDNTPTYPVNSTWVNAYEDGTASTAHSKNWCLLLNATGQESLKITPIVGTPTSAAPLTLQLKDLVDFGFWYEMQAGTHGPSVQIKVYEYSNATEAVGRWGNIRADPNNDIATTDLWSHYTLNNITSYVSGAYADTPFDLGTGGTGLSGFHSFEYWTSHLGEYYVGSVMITMDPAITGVDSRALIDDLSIAYLNKSSGIRYERVYNMEEDKLIPSDWNAYCSFAERVLINGTLIVRDGYNTTAHEPYYTINFENGTITLWHWSLESGYHLWVLPIGTHVKVLYSTIEENEKGRYEWIVVGTDAASIANVGAAYVAEAFDSIKDIAVLKTGMDIREATWGPNAPYVMSGPGTRLRSNYYDSLGRSHLRDDWCTTYPIASSNMIFIGGPRATLGTEYFNEFTNAFFAESEWVVNNTGQSNTIMGLSCWNRNTYSNNATTGYAQISVYKDLNGTIGFLVWGMNGDDGLYAAEWFWNYPAGITCPDDTIVYSGIEYLQHENPGVTDIILEITYPTADPTHQTVSIVERLGTISEKTPHDP
jgi:hypothetical protein